MTSGVEISLNRWLALDDGGRGPAVILLHGLGGLKELWAETLPALRQVGFRAIAYDHRGHGESSDVPPPWTIHDLANDLAPCWMCWEWTEPAWWAIRWGAGRCSNLPSTARIVSGR